MSSVFSGCARLVCRHVRHAACGSVLLVALGCGDEAPAPDPFVSRDSAGVEIAVSSRPAWGSSSPWSLSRAPIRTLGNGTLLGVENIALLENGDVAVASGRLREVRIFRGGDTLGVVIGGPGEGPGEFKRLTAVYGCSDGSLLVNDFDRVHRFTSTSDFVRASAVDREPGDGMLRIIGASGDCAKLLLRTGDRVVPARGSIERMPATFLWSTLEGDRDTLAAGLPGWEVTSLDGVEAPFIPWGTDSHAATAGDRAVIGTSTGASIQIFEGADLRRIVRWSPPANPVTGEDRRRYSDLRDAFVRDFPPVAGFLLELSDYPRIPESKPPFIDLKVDDQGSIWARRYPDHIAGRPEVFDHGGPGYERIPESEREPEVWTVFAPSGEWLGDLQLPPALELHAVAADRVAGVARDSLDVERVVVHRLERSG